MKLKIKSMIGNIREKEKKNIQSEQQEEKRIKKKKDRLRSLGTTSNISTFEL